MLFNYDGFKLGNNKQFYKSLENFVENNTNPKKLSATEILNTKINESSAGGVVDILFESEFKDEPLKCKDDWVCDCDEVITEEKTFDEKKRQFILIQNKYFDTEKSINKNYDVAQIYATSAKLSHIPDINTKIILMVNNKQLLDQKIVKAKNKNSELIYDIYGVKELEDWFRQLLNDLYETNDIDDFLKKINVKINRILPELSPKFHQQLFTQSTLRYNIDENYKLFIWGAVPRSGKSYMIADLISNSHMRHQDEPNNNILLILGAKNETYSQFIKMFKDYSNFEKYGIITSTSTEGDYKDKNIFILSQDWFKKDKIKDDTFNTTNAKNSKIFETISSKGRLDIYFDEVHKGGTTDIAENILQTFIKTGVSIDIFIMVTATFAKPNIRYNSFDKIDTFNKGLKIIEWGYEDQQNMKQVTNISNKENVIVSRSEEIEKKIIENVFNTYKNKYGLDNYLQIISDEYINHPQLVLIQPELINPETIIDMSAIFIKNLNCDACMEKQYLHELRDPYNIFNDVGRVEDLLNFIGKITQNDGKPPDLDIKSVYYSLKIMGAPIDKPHSELWFLPDKDLYLNPKDCRSKGKCKSVSTEINQDDDSTTKTGLPNIEALTRGLSFLIMKNAYLKKKYNVLIVHNSTPNYKDKITDSKISANTIYGDKGPIYHTIEPTNLANGIEKKDRNLSNYIKKCESITFKAGKSLIILTGAKMRLGISLPCVDIAFNFDNIRSVDNNIQTMFRVLTERTYQKKEYGYYVDFNKDRAINFLYEYNNTYGSGKKEEDVKKKLEYLHSLLILFNYNGLGLIEQPRDKRTKLYDKLLSELKMDQISYQQFNLGRTNIENMIKKTLLTVDMKLLQQFASIIDTTYKPNKPLKKLDKLLVKGSTKHSTTYPGEGEGEREGDEEGEGERGEDEEGEEDIIDDNQLLINIIAEILPSIIALLAIFSNDYNYDCNKLTDCIDKAISDIDNTYELCNCDNNDDSSIISCYLGPTYTKDELKKLLNKIKEIISSKKTEQLLTNVNNLFANIKDTMGKNSDGLIFDMNAEDIQAKIAQYLPVRDEKKNANGEVFTPQVLIEEMLDKLPKTVWSNPHLKWLDPANGIGNFPMMVYHELMKKLEWPPNKTDRSTHIIKNMLYMAELDPTNIRISKRIFGKDANIACGDFLTMDLLKKFGVDKFDVIVGNPPFNKENTENKDGKKKPRAGGINKLYEQITIHCLDILSEKGYILFVTPDNIMSGNTNIAYKEIIKFNTYFININNIKKTYFPKIGQSMCYFLVQKNKKISGFETTIINQKNDEIKVILENRPVNPISDWNNKTEKLIRKYINLEKNNFIRTTDSVKIHESSDGDITVIINANKSIRTNNKNIEGYKIPKYIFFRMQPSADGIMDKTGNFGLGQQIYYLPLSTYNSEQKILIDNFFKSNDYKTLQQITTTGQYLKDAFIKSLNINKILAEKDKAGIKIQSIVRGKQTRKNLEKKSGGSIKHTNNKKNNKLNKSRNKPKTRKFKGKKAKNTTINKKKLNRKIKKTKTTIKKNKGFFRF